MKRFLLACILSFPVYAFAQYTELGLGGGVSFNGQPSGNEYYKGDKSSINPTMLLSFLYNTASEAQIGAELRLLPLSSISTKQYSDANIGHSFGGSSKKIVYADMLTDISIVLNKKAVLGASELYLGVALGLNHTNSSTALNGDVIYKAPDGGLGYTLGLQAGYNVLTMGNLVVNFEAALRYYDISYGSHIYSVQTRKAALLNYGIMAFPMAITLRYRFYNNHNGMNTRTGSFDMDMYRRRNRVYPRSYNW